MIKIPKLSKALAEKVDEAESGNFEPVPEGIYRAVLEDEVESKESDKGIYWKWVFKITEEGEGKGRKMFLNTSLNEVAHWKLKEVFTAFGESTDTDTDDLIGREVKLYLVQKIAEAGTRKGDLVNEIKQVLPVNQATVDAKPGSTSKPKSKPKDDVVPLY